jgi:hypothetical protein
MKPLHAIVIAILFVVGALYWYATQQEQHYGPAAQRYLREALTDIGTWQREKIKRHLAPQTLAAIDDKQLDALIGRYRELGAFKRIDDLQFARLTAALSFFSSSILLSYHGTVVFEHGGATLTITLIAREGRLQIYNFSFGSPRFGAVAK